jgi:gluconolactonase
MVFRFEYHSLQNCLTTMLLKHLRLALFFGLLTSTVSSMLQAQSSLRTLGKIEVLDESLKSLVDPNSPMEVLADGFTWTEGPLWVKSEGDEHLLFSDIPRNSIFKWSPKTGITLFMNPSGYTGVTYYGLEPGSNGLTMSAQGELILCEHGDRRVSKLTKGGGKITLADKYQGRRLNSPNDAIVAKNGDVLFTDPPYGLPNRENDPRRELKHFGVYRIVAATGEVQLLTTSLQRPNGIVLSPDESKLYIAQSDPKKAIWMQFDVDKNFKVSNEKVFYDATSEVDKLPGLPDGMTVDSTGNLWATGPGGIYVFNPSGKLLGRLLTGERTSNCTFGEDGSSLFITADTNLLRIRTKTKGVQ